MTHELLYFIQKVKNTPKNLEKLFEQLGNLFIKAMIWFGMWEILYISYILDLPIILCIIIRKWNIGV